MSIRSKKGIQKRVFCSKNKLYYYSSKNIHNLTNKSGNQKLTFGIKNFIAQKRLFKNYSFLI